MYIAGGVIVASAILEGEVEGGGDEMHAFSIHAYLFLNGTQLVMRRS